MNDAPIGIFDSGLGGLTVARAVIDQLPHEAVLYVGDTARGLASSSRDTNARKFGSLHPGVTNFVFLDGHVDAIANETDLDVLRWYSTIGDGNDPTAPADGPDGGT